MIIEKEYVSLDTAKLLREVGFDVECDRYYDAYNKVVIDYKANEVKECVEYDRSYAYDAVEHLQEMYNFPISGIIFFEGGDFYIPEVWVVIEWLRLKHNILVRIMQKIDWGLTLDSIPFYDKDTFIFNIDTVNEYSQSLFNYLIGDKETYKYNSPTEAYKGAIDYILNNNILMK